MAEFEIGDVKITVDASGLTLWPRDRPEQEIRFDQDGVSELLDLLRISAQHVLSQRQGFRVPIRPSVALVTTLRVGTEAIVGTARNVSLTGIFVELASDAAPDWPLDFEVEVTMELDGRAVTTPGIVRRREAGAYGIFFPESVRGEQLNPPPALVRLIRKLESRWLAEG